MTYEEAAASLARELDMPVSVVDRTYKAFWKAAREHIASLPLKDGLTDAEFLGMRTSVNLPSIGKLGVTLDRYRAIRDSYMKTRKQKEEKDVTH